MNIQNCPICVSKLDNYKISKDHVHEIDCSQCGKFFILEIAFPKINRKLNERQRANASGWIREHQGSSFNTNNIDFLKNLKTPTVAEKADKLFLYLTKSFSKPGQLIDYENDLYKPFLFSISWCTDLYELIYILEDYLISTKRYVDKIATQDRKSCKITPEGWAYLDSLKHVNPDSQIAFVAMWFRDELNKLWDSMLKPAIENAGYEPVRIDKVEHINRIDDEIIATVRRSKFLIADFTGQRGGGVL